MGMMLSHIEVRTVHGFMYMQPVPFGAPAGASPPPKAVLYLLARLHPGIRKRLAQGQAAIEGKEWRNALRTWDEVDKPKSIKRHQSIQAMDPDGMSDNALIEHVRLLRAHLTEMISQHHRYTAVAVFPIGDLLAHLQEWTGKNPAELLLLLRGSTPISRGIGGAALDALADALRENPSARALLDKEDPADALRALREAPDPVGSAARSYLDEVSWRAMGFDVVERTPGEMPVMLTNAIRSVVAKPRASDKEVKPPESVLQIRAMIPDNKKSQFDELIEEARVCNRLRDERGVYSDCWAGGLARKGLLAVGRRLQKNGMLSDANLALEADAEELEALLRGARGVTEAELADRAQWRRDVPISDAPMYLGGPPSEPPPADLFPAAARRPMRAVSVAMENLFVTPPSKSSGQVVRGIGVSPGVYEGRVCLVTSEADFERVQQGDVLVTRATTAYFNVLLPLLGAIVTDRGGALSHAAIVSREYGIPGVVGTSDATKMMRDGMRVRVDGTKGEVTLL